MADNNEAFKTNLPTGFFVIGEDCLSDIKNKDYETTDSDDFEDGENLYEDARVFLNGSCHLFALALHEKYGYMALNLQTESNTNAHCFCKANYMGKDIYIDVRGITANLKEVISRFTSEEEPKMVLYDFSDEKVLSKADKHGLGFAKHIINIYPGFYNINELGDTQR